MFATAVACRREASATDYGRALRQLEPDVVERVGSLRGTVIDTNGAPVAHAVVALTGPTRLEFVADDLGRYHIQGLTPGWYSMSAVASGFARAWFGANGPFDAVRAFPISKNTPSAEASVVLQKAGVITGRVADEQDKPLADAVVSLLRISYVRGRRQLVPMPEVASARTDDQGQFRLSGLPEGEVAVEIAHSLQYETPSGSGRWRGYVRKRIPTDGTLLEIVAGGSLRVDAQLTTDELRIVSGTVLTSSGSRAPGGLVRVLGSASNPPIHVATIGSDGTFTIRAAKSATELVATVGGPATNEPTSWVEMARVSLTSGQVADLTLRTAPGAILRGTLRWRPPPDQNVPIRVYVRSLASGDPGLTSELVGPDGHFELRHVFEPSILVTDLPMSSEWAVQEVLWNGTDVSATGLPARVGDSIDGLQVLVTRSLGKVSGQIHSSSGVSTPGTAVVFPADRALWPLASRIRWAKSDATGLFEIDHLPQGKYFLSVRRHIDSGLVIDPAFLSTLVHDSQPLEVTHSSDTLRVTATLMQ